jgi:hypothetical protein
MNRSQAKRCPRCGQVKPPDLFYRRRGRRLSPYCQPYTRAASRLAPQRRRQDLATAETWPRPSGSDWSTGPASAATAPWATRTRVVVRREPAVHRRRPHAARGTGRRPRRRHSCGPVPGAGSRPGL